MIDLILAKQADDGTWGSPIDTAHAVRALYQANRGAARDWRERCRAFRDGLGHDLAAVERIAPAPLDRIHLAAVVAMLTERPGPMNEGFALDDQRFLRSIVSTAFTELSPDVFSAAGDLFLVLCPDSDPDNPVAPVVGEFRRRFQGEGLPAHDFGEEVALVYALHALGYDSFGPVWGYLMGDTMWEPAGD
jgi:hypothetical protein